LRGEQQPRGIAIDVEILVLLGLCRQSQHQASEENGGCPSHQPIVSQRVTGTQGARQGRAPEAAKALYLLEIEDVTVGRKRASPIRELMKYL